jgi:hypothetical protein
MGAPFRDITLYLPTPHIVGTPQYLEQISLENFVSDLYVQKMKGYKPPKTTRITIQPAFHDKWDHTWKNGSIIAIAPRFNYDEFKILDKQGQYKYLLDLIQGVTIQLSDEYKWDKTVFERAYNEVIESKFKFKVECTAKQSRDKKKVARLSIEKTETVTSVHVEIETTGSILKIKLFDKKNIWWYDCVYILARHNKWFDNDRFGISYGKGKIDMWYSIARNEVELFENGVRVTEINFKKIFIFG